MAVVVLNWCHAHQLLPRFRFTSPIYGRRDGRFDWLAELYTQPLAPAVPCELPELLITRWDDIPPMLRRGPARSAADLARLLHEHFHLTAHCADEFATLRRQLIGHEPTLGVHFRGGDKYLEAPPVSPAAMLAAVRRALREHPLQRVFYATDSLAFAAAIGDFIDEVPVVCAPGVLRSGDTTGVHFMPEGDPTAKARQALLDALLLGCCERLLKTESSLSQWTKLLHPALPIVQLNVRTRRPIWANWFPLEVFAPKLAEAVQSYAFHIASVPELSSIPR